MTDRRSDEPVGSLAEEAAKLLGALQQWGAGGGEHDRAGPGGPGPLSSILESLDEHIATGGRSCRYCPVCQVISLARAASPEVRDHLASAATSLLHAATSALNNQDGAEPRPEPGVEKIDVTDDAVDEPWD